MAGCRRGNLKCAATIMDDSFTTPPSQNIDVKGTDKPHVRQTLLMRAGDVESNPGPKSKHLSHSEKEDDFDDILENVARLIPDNKNIDSLGKALGFDPADIERYIATNTRYQHVTYDGTLKMLRDWRDTQRKAKERPALAHALKEAKLGRLADMPWRTSKVRTTLASDDLPHHDLLKSVVKDIKEYYKLNMCTIQADPTNNDVMFEFNHIYTDPTLLEEDRNDKTRRKPLHYCNLLKTKINGHLPNRLLVQGGGGAGKTTFCSKIAWDWANDLGFQQFKLVAVIPFRKAKNKTVGEVIKSYLSDNNPFTAAQIDEYILSNQEEVFLVLDGLDELWGKLSDPCQINRIIRNLLFMSGTVLVTSRQWRADEICSSTELKKVYAFIYIKGFSVDNVTAYINKLFYQDLASSQELIDFITSNDVIADNMAPFPIYIALLCIMWRESDGKRREAMSKLMTFSQLFDEMVAFLIDHCGSKDDSQTGPTVQELRQMIPNHLKAIGEIAFYGILDRRLEFPEDTFQSCRESMEMGCKVGVLTREKHATPRCDRRKNTRLEMSMVQFPHKLFQEFVAAKYLASLHSSDYDGYERIMAHILDKKEEIRYLLHFTSAQGKELGLDIVTRLIAQKEKEHIIFDDFFTKIMRSPFACHGPIRNMCHLSDQQSKERFIVDVAYESQHQSVAEKVGNQLGRSRTTLDITVMSPHTISGYLYIKDHLDEVDSLVLKRSCGRTSSQDLAEFILSSASLKTMEIGKPMHAVFYAMLADKVQQCQGNNQSTSLHASLRWVLVDDFILFGWQSCGDMFDSVENLTILFMDDFDFDFIQRVHGFQGVTYLTIVGRLDHKPYRVTDVPSTMIKHLVRVFPQLIKMTFGVHVGNAILKQILESLRETRGLTLKSFRVMRNGMDDHELDALVDEINDENVLRVEMENTRIFRQYPNGESDETPEEEPGDPKNLTDHEEGRDRQKGPEELGEDSDYETQL